MPILFRAYKANIVAKEMIFNPPSCIKNNNRTCPLKEKYVAVSTTVSPVTQLALIEVNKASKNDIEV